MPEENTTSAGTGAMPAPTSPEMGNTPAASQGAMPEAGSGEDLKAEYEKLKHSLKNAQEELDRHRKNAKKLSAYEEAEKAAKEAQLSEIEKTQTKLSELQAQHETYKQQTQTRIIRYEVQQQAAKLGIIDPDAAAKLLDWSELEYAEDGTPTNAEKLLTALVKSKPYLAPKAPEPAQQPATPAKQPQQPAPFIPPFSGRSSIPAPGGSTPGKIPSWNDIYKR
jgi:septal ring factor EnvC (AmiA/AmiB activator)